MYHWFFFLFVSAAILIGCGGDDKKDASASPKTTSHEATAASTVYGANLVGDKNIGPVHAGGNEAHASAGPSVPNLGGLDEGAKKRFVIVDPRAVHATRTTIPNDLAVEFKIDMRNDTLLKKEV